MEQLYIPKQDYKVLVRCFTFNQSSYIEDTLDGFALQQTNFPYVCLIVDDCSTDGEQEVIKEWMNRECDLERAECIELQLSSVVVVPHKANPFCTFAFYMLRQNLYRNEAKKYELVFPWREKCIYEAFCEGDDYWTLPDKLQLQVDWLDSHPDYGLSYTKAIVYDQVENKFSGTLGKAFEGVTALYDENHIPALTTVYRCDLISQYFEARVTEGKDWALGDYPQWLWMAHHAKIHFLDEVTSVYRVVANSTTHLPDPRSRIRFHQNCLDVITTINDIFHDFSDTRKYEDYYNGHSFLAAFRGGLKEEAVEYYGRMHRKTSRYRIRYFVLRQPFSFIYQIFRKFD